MTAFGDEQQRRDLDVAELSPSGDPVPSLHGGGDVDGQNSVTCGAVNAEDTIAAAVLTHPSDRDAGFRAALGRDAELWRACWPADSTSARVTVHSVP